jgi:hypothetical protein
MFLADPTWQFNLRLDAETIHPFQLLRSASGMDKGGFARAAMVGDRCRRSARPLAFTNESAGLGVSEDNIWILLQGFEIMAGKPMVVLGRDQ